MLSFTFSLSCVNAHHVQSRRAGRLQVVSLRKGITVEAKPPVEGKLNVRRDPGNSMFLGLHCSDQQGTARVSGDLRVQIDADVTGKAYDEALRELGRSVELPGQRKQKGGKATPLPKGLITSLVGKKKINRFVVDGLITESVCDYAAENNLQVPADLRYGQQTTLMWRSLSTLSVLPIDSCSVVLTMRASLIFPSSCSCSAAGVVQDIESVRTSFVAGKELAFEASTDVREVLE
eukprot:1182278-Prorocentrum_minimum.AAC.2